MNKKSYLKTAFWAALSTVLLNSCVKYDDYSVPTITCTDRFAATNHVLSDLVSVAKSAPTSADIIANDFIMEGYVSSSDEAGNIFKQIFIQDKPSNPTFAIEMDIDAGSLYTSFPVGSKVRINAKGLVASYYNGNMKLGAYDASYSGNGQIGRINPNYLANYMARTCGTDGLPVTATIVPVEFSSFGEATQPQNINKLVKINNVQFASAELAKSFIDTAPSTTASDRYLEDITGTSFDLRNSIYASFAKTPISPTYAGAGSITLIMSLYTSVSGSKTYQGYIRDLADVSFGDSSTRLSPVTSFYDDFNNLSNWTAVSVLGSQTWGTTSYGNPKPSAYMSGGTSSTNEDWLITKSISLTGKTSYYMAFESDGRYTGNPLEVYITDNYTGTPSTTTWSKLNPILDTDMNAFAGFVSSGIVDISSYKGKNVYIAFKYTSSPSTGSTAWEIDNFKVIGL